jgi:putative ABC transport system permease protein
MGLAPGEVAAIERRLGAHPDVEAWSRRLKFGGLFSNYAETTAIRLNGIDPEEELRTVPLLASRIAQGPAALAKGHIVVPDLLAKGMGVEVGDTVVVIATNRDGSVNAAQLTVGGVVESVTGPGGRDGYLHIEDAMALLRQDEPEISEIAVRLKEFDRLDRAARSLRGALLEAGEGGETGQLELHTWEGLSPFYNVAVLIDVLAVSAMLGLVAIVLISVMNVMLMSVYERVKEIGTMSAMGTMPGKILAMFVLEGLALGVLGVFIGNVVAAAAIVGLDGAGLTFDFGRQAGLVLSPQVNGAYMFLISVVVVAVAVVGTMQPAYKASRMTPVDALRHG